MFFIAVKQRLSDFLFQLTDTLCYGGLGNVVAVCEKLFNLARVIKVFMDCEFMALSLYFEQALGNVSIFQLLFRASLQNAGILSVKRIRQITFQT